MPQLDTRIRHLRSAAKRHGGEYLNRYLTVAIHPPPEDKLLSLDNGEDAYFYKFRSSIRQNDPILHLMKLIIREINQEDIYFAAAHVRVRATTDARPFWPIIDPLCPVYDAKLYTFLMDDHPYKEEFPISAWICVYTLAGDLHKDALYIKIGEEWLEFREWLLSKRHPEDLVGRAGYMAQYKWYKLNGKKFRLMDLPVELRLMIFERTLGPYLYPLRQVDCVHQASSIHWGLGLPKPNEWHHHKMPFTSDEHTIAGYTACKPNLAILRVSKQVRDEALQAGWQDTRKCFFGPSHLNSILGVSKAPYPKWLRKVILDFTMEGWFEFFGVQLWPNLHIDTTQSRGNLLATLPDLVHLQIWFRSPDDGWIASPWGSRFITGPFVCCQRTMVDWIMTFAWPFVKDIRKVTLGGVIKKDSKVKWDDLLALSKTTKANVFDHVQEQLNIFATLPTMLPPPCSCRNPCQATRESRVIIRYDSGKDEYEKEEAFDFEDD